MNTSSKVKVRLWLGLRNWVAGVSYAPLSSVSPVVFCIFWEGKFNAASKEQVWRFLLVQLLQLLKAIFGTNLAGQWESHVAAMALRPPVNRSTRSSAAGRPGIYHVCLNQPYIQLTQAMASTTMKMHTPQTTSSTGSAATVEHEDSTRSAFSVV